MFQDDSMGGEDHLFDFRNQFRHALRDSKRIQHVLLQTRALKMTSLSRILTHLNRRVDNDDNNIRF
jgi:hypothetical protein